MSSPTPYRSLVPYPRIERLAMAASILLGLGALALLFAVDFMLAQLADLPFLRDGFPISDLEIAIDHTRMAGIARAIAALAISSAAVWLVWQFQAHANLRALGLRRTRFAPATGVLSWVVPVANLVLPALAVGELWRVADPDVAPAGTGPAPGRRWGATLVGAWWLALLATVALAVRGFAQAPMSNASAEQLIARNHWLIPACLVGMVAAALAIVVVNRIVGRLQLKEDQIRFPGWEAWTTAHRAGRGPVSGS